MKAPRAPRAIASPRPAAASPADAGRRSDRAWLAASLLLGVLVSVWVFSQVSAIRPLVEWDEGGYLWKSHLVAAALRAGNLGEAWRLAAADSLKPPLQAVFNALASLAFGETLPVAFGFSALCLALAFPLIWRAGRDLGGRAAAGIAVLFLAGSRLHLEYSATALLEVPGTTLTLVAIVLDLRARRSRAAGPGWQAGFALLALFFYKYNYGMLLAAALLIADLLEGPRRPLSPARRGVWIPVLVGAAVWFLHPDKLQGFFEFAQNRDSGLGLLASLLYYPRAVLDHYAAWRPAGIALIAGALLALRLHARPAVRAMILFAGLGLAAMVAHPYKLERSIATVAPALWLLAGAGWASLLDAMRPRPALAGGLAVALALVLLVPLPALYARDLPAIRRTIETGAPHPWSRVAWPGRDLVAVEAAILDSVAAGVPVYIGGEFNELSPTVLTWRFAVRDPGTPVVTQCFREAEPPRLPCNVVTLEVLPTSHYFNDDYRRYCSWALDPIHEVARHAPPPAFDRTFEPAGVRLRIYRL